jgi:cytochrome c biogenesis protein CcmG/thiol:disulfide interchange protein DsbE
VAIDSMGYRWVGRLAQADGSEYYSKWVRIALTISRKWSAPEKTMSKLSQILASKMGTRIFSALVLVVAVGVVVLFAAPSYRQGEGSIAGRTAQDFAMELNGRPAHLSDLRGKVVVLVFWASWCPPCVAEIDSLNALHKLISAQGGTVLGISVDEDAAAYEKFLRDHNVPFPNYRDASKQIAVNYGTAMYPETYVIGRDGRFLRKIVSAQEWDGPDLVGYFESVLTTQSK